MSHKRILLVINVDWYFNLHWLDRAEYFQSSGYEVHLCTRITSQILFEKFINLGFFVHPISLRRSTLSFVNAIRVINEISAVVKKIHPILLHSITVKPNTFCGLVCRFYGVPQIMSVTGLGQAFSGERLKDVFSRIVIVSLYKFVASRKKLRIIFENAEDLNLFLSRHLALPEKLILIPGAGVDTEKFPYTREAFNQRDPLVILFAARMLKDKGLGDLIKAAAILRDKGISFKLNVAGLLDEDNDSAIHKDEIEKWHNQGLINWLGSVENIVPEIVKASIVVLPTKYGEGVPRILIESASVGRALIATNVVGCRDIVIDGKNGYLVPPNDCLILSRAIEKLLFDYELRCEFGRSGRRLVEEKFSKQNVLSKTSSVYKDLLQGMDHL